MIVRCFPDGIQSAGRNLGSTREGEILMLLSYIDPAVGSMLLQVLAAIFLAGGVFFRRFLFLPFRFFAKKEQKDLSDDE